MTWINYKKVSIIKAKQDRRAQDLAKWISVAQCEMKGYEMASSDSESGELLCLQISF